MNLSNYMELLSNYMELLSNYSELLSNYAHLSNYSDYLKTIQLALTCHLFRVPISSIWIQKHLNYFWEMSGIPSRWFPVDSAHFRLGWADILRPGGVPTQKAISPLFQNNLRLNIFSFLYVHGNFVKSVCTFFEFRHTYYEKNAAIYMTLYS